MTPEGRVIEPKDSSWWSLMVRNARSFITVYHQASKLRQQVQALEARLSMNVMQALEGSRLRDGASAEGAFQLCHHRSNTPRASEVHVTPHFSLTGDTNQPKPAFLEVLKEEPVTPQIREISPTFAVNTCPAYARMVRVRYAQNLLKGGAK